MKILENNIDNILINENIVLDEKSPSLNLLNILEENENLPEITDNINLENILKFDFKKFLNFDLKLNQAGNHNDDNEINNNNEINDLDFNNFEQEKKEENNILGKKRYKEINTEEDCYNSDFEENEKLKNFKKLKNEIISK